MISPVKKRIEYSISAKNELSQLDARFAVRLRRAFFLSLVLNALMLSAFSVLHKSRTDTDSSTQPIEITRLVLSAPVRSNATNALPKNASFSPRAKSATTQLKDERQSSRAESITSLSRQPTRFQNRYNTRETRSRKADEKRFSSSAQHKTPTAPVSESSKQPNATERKVASSSFKPTTTEKSGANKRFGAAGKTTSYSSATNRGSRNNANGDGNLAQSAGSSTMSGSTRQANETSRFTPANTTTSTSFSKPQPQPTSTPTVPPTPKPTPERTRDATPREAAPQPTPRQPRGETRKARATRQFEPMIPENMRDEEFKKSVRVRVVVRADGNFDVSLRGSSGNGRIDELTLETLRRWRWKPALQEGEPVESVQNFRVDFNVE